MILVAAATPDELRGADGASTLVCGVGPVEAAARTAAALAAERPDAVLRAAALAGIPAVEVRVLSNAIGEPDRAKWRFAEAKDALAAALPALVEEVSRAHA